MKQNKGMSDVVVTVLTILIIICAIAVIGSIIFRAGNSYIEQQENNEYCLYKIPDMIKFYCSERNITAFALSVYGFTLAMSNNNCESYDINPETEEEMTYHYEILRCREDLPFNSTKFILNTLD